MRFARGVWGHAPEKMSNLVRSGVNLGQIWSLIFFKLPFFIKKILKIPLFYIKNKYFRYMLAMG